MIISNASPLIYLSKIQRLDLLKLLFNEITIPQKVFEEVVVGKKEFLDSLKVEKAVNDGWIKICEIKPQKELEKFTPEIDIGEIHVISLAEKLKPKLILIDDASARTIAESLGFNVKGTLYVLLKAYKEKLLTKNETKKSINNLVFSGFRISHELYIQVLEELEKS